MIRAVFTYNEMQGDHLFVRQRTYEVETIPCKGETVVLEDNSYPFEVKNVTHFIGSGGAISVELK
jgi:hypothetical protein